MLSVKNRAITIPNEEIGDIKQVMIASVLNFFLPINTDSNE